MTPSSNLAISPILAETSKGKSKAPGNILMASETHSGPSKSPGNISMASETHTSPSKSPGDDATMTLETH